MILIGAILALAFFLFGGWLISMEMFQQRSWRRRAAAGDHEITAALILEAMAAWRTARPPGDRPVSVWAGVQRAELVAATAETATVQSSAEGEFRSTVEGRERVSSALDEAFALATGLVEMMLYDIPNLSLGSVRVDVYSTFPADDGAALQQPILTTTARRRDASAADWEGLAPAELLARFETAYQLGANGSALPIALSPVPGLCPPTPDHPAPASAEGERRAS